MKHNMKANYSSWLLSVAMSAFLALAGSLSSFAAHPVGGVVKTRAGDPLMGASVVEKGSTNGAMVDAGGSFSLNVSDPGSTLAISFIGYAPQEAQVNGASFFNILMEEDEKGLDEIVVVAYGTQKKSSITGAIAVVSSEELKPVTSPTVNTMLQGKVAGAQPILPSFSFTPSLVSEAQREFTYDDILVAGTGKSVGVKPADAEQERSGQTSATLVAQANPNLDFPPERLQRARSVIELVISRANERGAYTADMEERLNAEFKKLGKDEKAKPRVDAMIRIINNRGISKYNESKLFPANGKIDKTAAQGRLNDCWLLSPINSLAASPNGKKILEDMVQVDANNNVTVTLKGEKYKISEAELKGSDHLSNGDLDIRAIEIAVERYVLEHGAKAGGETEYTIHNGWSNFAMKLLTGKKAYHLKEANKINETIRNFDINKNVVTCFTNTETPVKLIDENGKAYEYARNHEYAVVGKDEKYVYMVDPYNPNRKLHVSIEDFLRATNRMNKCDL